MAKKWKEIGGFREATQIAVNDTVGQVTEGIYQGRQEHIGENDSQVHYIDVNGEPSKFWGSSVLDGRLAEVNVGNTVRITFTGKMKSKTPGRKGYYNYKIEVAEPEETKVAPTEDENGIPF